MDIIMKSALKRKDLEYRESIGERDIELQLMSDFNEKDYDITEGMDMIKESNVYITAVHTPIAKLYDIGLESILIPEYKRIFNRVCNFANELGRKQNSKVMVIIHMYSDVENAIRHNRLELVDAELLNIFENFNNIDIIIENVMPIEIRDSKIYTTNGFFDNNVRYCNYFKERYGYNERLGTVLDICHATISERLIKSLGSNKNVSLEDYFKWNKDDIRLIHLSDTVNTGYGNNEHGVGFKSPNNLLKTFVQLYNKYEYKCPVTIEVQEKDYCNCEEYIRSKKLLIDEIIK